MKTKPPGLLLREFCSLCRKLLFSNNMTAPAQNKLKSVAIKIALGGVLIALVGLVYLFFTPKLFQASAKNQG